MRRALETEELFNALKEGDAGGTGQIDGAVGGHEDLNGFELRIFRAKGAAGIDVLIDEIFDGVTEDFEGMSGLRGDHARADGGLGGKSLQARVEL